MLRIAAALLVLGLAAPAHALPLSYDFVATSDGQSFSGSLVYDPDSATLVSFTAPGHGFPIPAFDWLAPDASWPTRRELFPLLGMSVQLEPGELDGATIHVHTAFVVTPPNPYACAPGTDFPDCPRDAFIREDGDRDYTLQVTPTPEPSVLWLALGAVACGARRARHRAR